MIHYSLKCEHDHGFDSWFASADAFDGLAARGLVSCPDCGSTRIVKALMAPAVVETRARALPAAPAENSREAALAALRRHVEENSEYVGMNFATEARAIHEGEAPERPIYGEAAIEDARAMIEDGLPVAPLPFRPARKSN